MGAVGVVANQPNLAQQEQDRIKAQQQAAAAQAAQQSIASMSGIQASHDAQQVQAQPQMAAPSGGGGAYSAPQSITESYSTMQPAMSGIQQATSPMPQMPAAAAPVAAGADPGTSALSLSLGEQGAQQDMGGAVDMPAMGSPRTGMGTRIRPIDSMALAGLGRRVY